MVATESWVLSGLLEVLVKHIPTRGLGHSALLRIRKLLILNHPIRLRINPTFTLLIKRFSKLLVTLSRQKVGRRVPLHKRSASLVIVIVNVLVDIELEPDMVLL